MIIHVTDSIWLDDTGLCSVEQLADASGLSIEEVDDLIRNGVIVPVDDKAQPPSFRMHYMVTARTARKLRDDFELDRHGVALALTLLREIDRLETDLNAARAKLRRAIER
jgi:chaperone modulatory protein CbpM